MCMLTCAPPTPRLQNRHCASPHHTSSGLPAVAAPTTRLRARLSAPEPPAAAPEAAAATVPVHAQARWRSQSFCGAPPCTTGAPPPPPPRHAHPSATPSTAATNPSQPALQLNPAPPSPPPGLGAHLQVRPVAAGCPFEGQGRQQRFAGPPDVHIVILWVLLCYYP